MTCLWAGKVTSDTQQMSIRFGVSTILEPMHLHRTADACAVGPSRSLTAAEERIRPAPQVPPGGRGLGWQRYQHSTLSSWTESGRQLCRHTHRDAPSSQASWNAYSPTLNHADAGAPPSASVLDDRAVNTTPRPSARALSASDAGVMHSTLAKTRSNCCIAANSAKSVSCTTVTAFFNG